MSDVANQVEKNLDELHARMGAACRRVNRPEDSVTLVAVTKTVDAATAKLLCDLGVRDFGVYLGLDGPFKSD